MLRFVNQVRYALAGLLFLIRTERHFQIHIVAFLVVIFLGVYFDLNTSEWLNILIASCLVLFAEAVNTSIEKLCDIYTRELNEQIKMVKDIAAGAVLIVVIFAIIVGGFVFYPHVKLLFH